MAEHCGKLDEPLGAEELAVLRRASLAPRHCGWVYADRQVFVGQATLREDVVHYISARISRQLGGMLEAFEPKSTAGASR